MGRQKNEIKEDAFRGKYDSQIGRKLRTKKEGAPKVGGATANEEFINYMQGKAPGRFRDLPSIAAMRQKATNYKANVSKYETPEQLARRQRRRSNY